MADTLSMFEHRIDHDAKHNQEQHGDHDHEMIVNLECIAGDRGDRPGEIPAVIGPRQLGNRRQEQTQERKTRPQTETTKDLQFVSLKYLVGAKLHPGFVSVLWQAPSSALPSTDCPPRLACHAN